MSDPKNNAIEILTEKLSDNSYHRTKPVYDPNKNTITYLEPIEVPRKVLMKNGLVSGTVNLMKITLQNRNESFTISEANKAEIYIISDILLSDTHNKGIYLVGDNGRGKTFVMKHMIRAIEVAYNQFKVENVPMIPYRRKKLLHDKLDVLVINYKIDVVLRSKNEGGIGWMKELSDKVSPDIIMVDDMAYVGQTTANLYGSREDFIPDLVEILYHHYNRGSRIIITSNITIKVMYEMYGQAPGMSGPIDRIVEMTTAVKWIGENLRTKSVAQ